MSFSQTALVDLTPDVNSFGLHSFVHNWRIKRTSDANGCAAMMMVMSAADTESANADANAAAFASFNGLQKDAVGTEPGCFHSDFFDGSIDI